jgi:acyl carrier protein
MTKTNKKTGNEAETHGNGQRSRLTEALQAWMVVRLSEELSVPPEGIDVHEPLVSYGLSSMVAFGLTGELADRLGCELPATLFWDWPTLEALAGYLAGEVKDGQAAKSLLAEIHHMLSCVEALPENELSQSGKKQN